MARARALFAGGNPDAAAAHIENFLAGPGRRAAPPDQAVLHFEAGRISVEAFAPERARRHLERTEAIVASAAFRGQPLLAARIFRALASLRERLGDVSQALTLLTDALPALERLDPAASAEAKNARGILLIEALRYAEAEADFRLARDQAEVLRAPVGLRLSIATNLILVATEQGQLRRAREELAQAERLIGGLVEHQRVLDFAKAQLLARELDLAGAEALLAQVADQSADHDILRGHALMALATAHFNRGRMPEAIQAATRSVEAYRIALGERHPAYGRALHTLGVSLSEFGDTAAAGPLLAQASSVQAAAFGSNAPQVQATEIERGWLEVRTGDITTAARRAISALRSFTERPPIDARPIGLALVLRGLTLERTGRYREAADDYRQGQARIVEARGETSPDLGFSLVRLGRLLTRMDRYGEALSTLNRAVAIYETSGGAATVRLSEALTARAELRAQTGERSVALEDARRALALLSERIELIEQVGGGSSGGQRRGARELYAALARLLLTLAPGDRRATDEAFSASQQALISRAGDALRRAARRRALAGGELGRLVDERDKAAESSAQSDALLLALAGAERRFRADETQRLREAGEAAATRVRDLDGEIANRFPRYSRYMRPRPERLADVQATLRTDEAIVAPIVTDEGLLIWGIRRERAEAYRGPVDAGELAALVERVRRGVDLRHLAQNPAEPFDDEAARSIFDALFKGFDRIGFLDGISDIVFVPDRALESLSPHLLRDQNDRWLVRRFAVTVAPSVGAVVAIREERGRSSTAGRAFLGIGDPDFTRFAVPLSNGGGGMSERLRPALATLSLLPETRLELQRLAEIYGQGQSLLLLGAEASERNFLEANIRDYRVLSFATHALMAGELQDLPEPAIVLTSSESEGVFDGLLTASDIASLELDADLVLLSACNTAAPDGGPYTEGLSGLARSFMQAGARTLLVSHWTIASDATTRLIIEFAAEANQRPDRLAEALRTAMLRMVDGEDAALKHPALWAPFVVVGG